MTSIYKDRPDLVADARALDRALRPVVDRVLARLGLTREQVLAEQPPPRPVAAPGRVVGTDPGEVGMLPLSDWGPGHESGRAA